MPPLIFLIFPLGTQDALFFSKKANQYSTALEQRITALPCDQSNTDILKNKNKISVEKPDIVIFGPSMDEKPFTKYSKLILADRPGMRSTSQAKPLIYHYENQFSLDPENFLQNEVDEYFSTLEEIITALLNHNGRV